jgi:acyl carrier protein
MNAGEIMKTVDAVRKFVVENFLFGDGTRLQDDSSFMQNGIIDSTGVLELIAFVEETYSIKIEDQELVPENMDSLINVAAFVDRKLASAGAHSTPTRV